MCFFGGQHVRCAPEDRHPRVQSVLAAHASILSQSVHLLQQAIGNDLLQVVRSSPGPRQPKDGRAASERTLVDSALSMPDAVRFAWDLSFPPPVDALDPVLSSVVKAVADSALDIIEVRAERRRVISRVCKILHPLTH